VIRSILSRPGDSYLLILNPDKKNPKATQIPRLDLDFSWPPVPCRIIEIEAGDLKERGVVVPLPAHNTQIENTKRSTVADRGRNLHARLNLHCIESMIN